MCLWLRTTVVHSTALNSSNKLLSCSPDSHHSSDDVCWREGCHTVGLMKKEWSIAYSFVYRSSEHSKQEIFMPSSLPLWFFPFTLSLIERLWPQPLYTTARLLVGFLIGWEPNQARIARNKIFVPFPLISFPLTELEHMALTPAIPQLRHYLHWRSVNGVMVMYTTRLCGSLFGKSMKSHWF